MPVLSNESLLNATNSSSALPTWIVYKTTLDVWLGVVAVLIGIGTVLNLPLFLTIATSDKLNTGSGALIAHLLFLESMLCAVWNPIICISMYTAHITPLSNTFCQYSLFGYYIFLHCANWSTLLLAINRFVAIMFPHQYSKFSNKPALLSSMSFAWIVAIAFNMPGFLGISGNYRPIPPWGGCGMKVTMLWFNSLTTAALTSLPVSGIGLAYISMFVKMGVAWCLSRNALVTPHKNAGTKADGADNQPSRNLLRKRYDSVKMLFISYLWYSLCYLLPPIASSVYTQAYASMPALQLAFRGIALMGYALNPVIYISMNQDYRKRLLKMLFGNQRYSGTNTLTTTRAQSQADPAGTSSKD